MNTPPTSTAPWATPATVGRPTVDMYADGIPAVGSHRPYNVEDPYRPPDAEPVGVVASAVKIASRIRTFEGMRGYSVRVAVWLRHAFYVLVVLCCSALTDWAFSTQPAWQFGGYLMLYTVSFMVAVAAVGSVLYAESRMKIAEQFRQFTFGIIVLPGTAIALMTRVLAAALGGQAAQGDQFLSLLTGNGVPLLYFATVVIPAAVFTKYVFGGIRAAQRNGLEDAEALALYARQDGRQR